LPLASGDDLRCASRNSRPGAQRCLHFHFGTFFSVLISADSSKTPLEHGSLRGVRSHRLQVSQVFQVYEWRNSHKYRPYSQSFVAYLSSVFVRTDISDLPYGHRLSRWSFERDTSCSTHGLGGYLEIIAGNRWRWNTVSDRPLSMGEDIYIG